MMSSELVPAKLLPNDSAGPREEVRPVTTTATAYAPGSIGNVGPGFDILGLAVDGAGDRVTARVVDEAGVRVVASGDPALPLDGRRHSSAIAASAVLRRAGVRGWGLEIEVEKGLPLSGGQGGSAASAAAGAMAANLILGEPLSRVELVECALEAESIVAGRHADNVAPAVLGGLVLVRSLEPLDLLELEPPRAWRVVWVKPEQEMRTAVARSIVPHVVSRALAMQQAANVTALVLAIARGDGELARRALDDRLAEPARSPALPGFVEAKRAALEAGAFGCSISGSGPTAFAFASPEGAPAVLEAMLDAYRAHGAHVDGRIARVDERGARGV
jgi:homoserine kinase